MTEKNEVLRENPVSSYLFNDVFHAYIEVYSGHVMKAWRGGGVFRYRSIHFPP